MIYGTYNGRQVCSVMQACTLTGMCRRTIYGWMKAGRIEYVLAPSGARRIYVDSLFREKTEHDAA